MSKDKIATIIKEAAETEAARFEEEFEAIRQRCDSPIEELLLAAMYADHRIQEFEVFFMGTLKPSERYVRGETIYIYQQAKVGRYRCDFLILDASCPLEVKEPRWMVVECDGHEYHERTKEQAKRDKARDRFFQGKGYRVLRFTGSEIWNDPAGTAEEVFSHLSRDDGWREREQ